MRLNLNLAVILAIVLAVLALVAQINSSASLSARAYPHQSASEPHLLGVWKTRTVSEDNLNGAYNGFIVFGPDYYEIQNNVATTPIRISDVRYRTEGSQVAFWVEGNHQLPSHVTLLNDDRATLDMPSQNNLVLYLYRQD